MKIEIDLQVNPVSELEKAIAEELKSTEEKPLQELLDESKNTTVNSSVSL